MARKITFLLMLLMTSLGYSQQVLLENFESGSAIDAGFSGLASTAIVADPEAMGTRGMVAQLVAQSAGDPWQGANITLSPNVDLTTDKTMKMDLYSLSPIAILAKVDNGISGAPASAVEVVHGGTGWEEITFSFTTPRDNTTMNANGTYPTLAIFPNWDTSLNSGNGGFFNPAIDRTIYIDNIYGVAAGVAPTCDDGIQNQDETGVDCGGTSCVPCTVPGSAASTPPNREASSVVALFSDAYTDIGAPLATFGTNPNLNVFQIGGNDTQAFTSGAPGSGYQFVPGIPNGEDLSGTTHFHIDFWNDGAVEPGQLLQIILQQFDGGGAFQHNIIYSVDLNGAATGQWVSVDVEISSFANGGLSRNNIGQIQIVLAGANNLGPIFIDNIYFHSNTVLGVEDNKLLSFRAYPNPAKDNWTIQSRNNTKIESIEVFDLLGKTIKTLKPNNSQAIIDGNSLRGGLYFAKVKTAEGLQSLRLVKN